MNVDGWVSTSKWKLMSQQSHSLILISSILQHQLRIGSWMLGIGWILIILYGMVTNSQTWVWCWVTNPNSCAWDRLSPMNEWVTILSQHQSLLVSSVNHSWTFVSRQHSFINHFWRQAWLKVNWCHTIILILNSILLSGWCRKRMWMSVDIIPHILHPLPHTHSSVCECVKEWERMW